MIQNGTFGTEEHIMNIICIYHMAQASTTDPFTFTCMHVNDEKIECALVSLYLCVHVHSFLQVICMCSPFLLEYNYTVIIMQSNIPTLIVQVYDCENNFSCL